MIVQQSLAESCCATSDLVKGAVSPLLLGVSGFVVKPDESGAGASAVVDCLVDSVVPSSDLVSAHTLYPPKTNKAGMRNAINSFLFDMRPP
jgi:hypothetical protein